MKLNHVTLTVTDVRAAGFFKTYFGMRQMGGNASVERGMKKGRRTMAKVAKNAKRAKRAKAGG